MTDSFGARLRRERERQKISLADIAVQTKIKASLFEELERDDPSHWPTGIFRRSFMRAYANALGMDTDAALREFLQRFPDPASPVAAETSAAAPAAPRSTEAAPITSAALAEGGGGTSRTNSTLRLTLVETGLPFTGGRFLVDARRRWSAAAWDFGSLLAIALSLYVFMDTFWMPFGVTALCYYVGGVLILGNSPGVCLFAPRPHNTGGSKLSRVPRHRPVGASAVPAVEAAFRAGRFRVGRQRELPN